MRPTAEDGDAHAFKIADHQFGVVARHARMGKSGQIGIVDGGAVHRVGQMAKPRPKDQTDADRRIACARPDQIGEVTQRSLT